MCTVSMIGDFYKDKWYPSQIYPQPYWPETVTTGDFEALKKEVLEMKELLKRALKYDKENNQPHCEMEEKVKILKDVAKLVGVELAELIP